MEVLWFRPNLITVTAVRSQLYVNRTNERQPDHTMYGAGIHRNEANSGSASPGCDDNGRHVQ